MSITTRVANMTWKLFTAARHIRQDGQLPIPSWSTSPILKRSERYFPPLGPRVTSSVCPSCQLETRDAIIRGKLDSAALYAENSLIPAQIVEVGGRVVMRKTCSRHGDTEEILANDPAFFWRLERLFPGCDFPHESFTPQGAHAVRYGRGSFLIIDLTTRCNMKCEPCFMNANEIGRVQELSLTDIRAQLDHALTIRPMREVNILFSGGEPTLSAHFLEAVSYAKEIGLDRLHVATNGLKFAEDPDFAVAAKGAGLHGVYLQLDGINNETNVHRGISNFFDLKVEAIRNISAAGMHTTLQATIIKGVNDHQVSRIVEFAVEHADDVLGIVFQPVMFTGRDEQIRESRRRAQRYSYSDLPHDLSEQSSFEWRPDRDWFPMGTYATLANFLDMLQPYRHFGATSVNAHPNAMAISPLIVNSVTRETVSLTSFFNLESFLEDIELILTRAYGRGTSKVAFLAAAVRHFDPKRAPKDFSLPELFRLIDRAGARFASVDIERIAYDDAWRLLIVAQSHFQDLFNYELPNIQLSTALVADLGLDGRTPSEMPFSFKNAAGWRQILERDPSLPSLSEWHRSRGRHSIYANGISVTIEDLAGTAMQRSDEKPAAAV